MTPSTFHRRNVTGRPVRNELNRKKPNGRKSCQANTISSNSMKRPPNTLTFLGNNNSTHESSTNFSLSQLTMSQLSDSMSHQTRPSKVARTSMQMRPSQSVRQSYCVNDNFDEEKKFNFQHRLSKGIHPTKTRRTINETRPTLEPKNIVSQQENNSIDFNECDNFDSQLRSQELLFSPHLTSRRNQSYPSNEKSTIKNSNPRPETEMNMNASSTPGATSRSSTRKRSWMEACIEVMKTPYRKGKSIAQRISKPLIKIDYDDNVASNRNDTKYDQENLAIKASPSTSVSVVNKNVNNQLTPTIGTSNDLSTTSALQVLNETKDIWKKIESMKEEIAKEKDELQGIRSSISDEKNALIKAREDLEIAKKDFDQKKEKFAIEILAAGQKSNALVRDLDATHNEAVEGMKVLQQKFLADLSTKEDEIVSNLDACKDMLSDVKLNVNTCKSMVDEMKMIQKKATLITPMKSSITSHVNTQKVRVGLNNTFEQTAGDNGSNEQVTILRATTTEKKQPSTKDSNTRDCKNVTSSEEDSDNSNVSQDAQRRNQDIVSSIQPWVQRSSQSSKSELPRYNLRSNDMNLNSVGIHVNADSTGNKNLMPVSNRDKGVGTTNEKSMTTRTCRRKIKIKKINKSLPSSPQNIKAKDRLNFNASETKTSYSTNYQSDSTKMQAHNKNVLTYGRSTRRRRFNGQGVNSINVHVGSNRQSDNVNTTMNTRKSIGITRVFTPNDFLSPDNDAISGNNSRFAANLADARPVGRQRRPPSASPNAASSLGMPPPLPHFDDTSGPQRIFIAPRFTLFSADDDSLSFK